MEINGLSSNTLLNVAEMIAQDLLQEKLLVKDLNRNKIYTANTTAVSNNRKADKESSKQL